ncbi:MAG: hypothetical protein AAFN93_11165, partial [Bacteroidota bacterium]
LCHKEKGSYSILTCYFGITAKMPNSITCRGAGRKCIETFNNYLWINTITPQKHGLTFKN